jgi:hypothetical protein
MVLVVNSWFWVNFQRGQLCEMAYIWKVLIQGNSAEYGKCKQIVTRNEVAEKIPENRDGNGATSD